MGRGMGRGMCKGGGSSIPDWLRIWEISKLSIASWIVAGSIGYVLCALPPLPEPGLCRIAAHGTPYIATLFTHRDPAQVVPHD